MVCKHAYLPCHVEVYTKLLGEGDNDVLRLTAALFPRPQPWPTAVWQDSWQHSLLLPTSTWARLSTMHRSPQSRHHTQNFSHTLHGKDFFSLNVLPQKHINYEKYIDRLYYKMAQDKVTKGKGRIPMIVTP